MKINRGCGCPLLVLAVVNFAFVISAIIAVIRGPDSQPVTANRLGSALALAVFIGNLIVCAIVALTALRGQRFDPSADETAFAGDSAGEGTDADSGEDE